VSGRGSKGIADGALDGLHADERRRLEAFATLFDRLDAGSYVTFAESYETDEVAEAKDRAAALLERGARRDAAKAAIDAFVDEATVAYARRMSLTDTLLLYQSLPDRAEDRVRFLQSVERVVVALILWDELSEDDRSALLGAWGRVVDPDTER
jgi:hypothetical protein